MTISKTIRNLSTIAFVACLLISLSACAADPAPKPDALVAQPNAPVAKPDDAAKSTPAPQDVVAEVNGSELTQSELDSAMLQAIQAQGLDRLPPEMMDKVRADLTPNLIAGFVSRILLQKDAEDQGFKVDSKEVDETIADIKKKFPDADSFAAVLKENNSSEKKLRSDIETEMRIKQLIEKCVATLPAVSEEDIKAFYESDKDKFQTPESVHARHVLVACADTEDEKTRTEKKALAEKVRKKIVDGSDFAEMAKEHSDCPSRENGGDLGTFGRGQMVGPFEDAAFLQKADEVGPVVTTKFGYHIIQVLERSDAGVTPLEDVSDKISGYLQSQREQEAILDYIDGLKKKAKITYRDPQPEPSAKPSATD